MRILQISSARHFGGGERHVVDLSRGLVERGYDVFAALRPTSTWQKRLGFLPPENILQVSIRNSFGVLSAKRIADFVREHDIQIVHAHVARDYVPASLACSMARRSKFVLTRHVMFSLKPFNRFALKNLSKAIAVSAGVEASLRKVFPAEKVVCIPNGIDLEARQSPQDPETDFRVSHNIPASAVVMLTLGELTLMKGQRDFVMAAQLVAEKCPAAYFVVVGVDNSPGRKFRRELKRLVRVFDLEDRFLFLNWVEDTVPLLNAADIFVSASHSESFGLAILEAMAAGTAVVATATEGGRELIRDENLLVPIEDPTALAAAMIRYAGSEERRRELAQLLKERAETEYSLERMVDSTVNLYESLVRGQKFPVTV